MTHPPEKLNTILQMTRPALDRPVRKQFMTKDGLRISIQASCYHYCNPRNNTGPYDQLELGFPSDSDVEEISEYAEEPELELTGNVYPYVPVQVVCDLINRRGGF